MTFTRSSRQSPARRAGFSPRKAARTVYFPDGCRAYASQLERLGPHKTGPLYLHLKAFSPINLAVLDAPSEQVRYERTAACVSAHRAASTAAAGPVLASRKPVPAQRARPCGSLRRAASARTVLVR